MSGVGQGIAGAAGILAATYLVTLGMTDEAIGVAIATAILITMIGGDDG